MARTDETQKGLEPVHGKALTAPPTTSGRGLGFATNRRKIAKVGV